VIPLIELDPAALFAQWAPVLVQAFLVLAVGLPFARLLSRGAERAVERSPSPEFAAPAARAVSYSLTAITFALTLEVLGFDLGVLLGAAGLVTVALGFAAQTSASNLISGIFLIFEGSFKVGDVIQVAGTVGTVISVDLLSVKVRTFDNLLVRIPNETLVKSELTNLTRYPLRRVDVVVTVPHETDLARVQAALFDAADDDPEFLEQPAPEVRILELNELGVRVQVLAWVATNNVVSGKTKLMAAVKAAFDRAQLRVATPERVVRLAPERAPQSQVTNIE
jgi:small-conductance mechanosensitive channel